MKLNLFDGARRIFIAVTRWVIETPSRAVEEAYQAAVNIKKIEDEYFSGNPISDTGGYSENTYGLFRTQLRKYLSEIDIRLFEYKTSSNLPYLLPRNSLEAIAQPLGNPNLGKFQPSMLQKLAFIDFTISRYRIQPSQNTHETSDAVQLLDMAAIDRNLDSDEQDKFVFFLDGDKNSNSNPEIVPVEKSIIPGSFARTFDRIRRNLTSSYTAYEKDIVDELRQSRKRINAALKYVGLVIVLVIAVQQLSKLVIYSPLVDYLATNSTIEINFSPSLEKETVEEFRATKAKLELERLIGQLSSLTDTEYEELIQKKALEIVRNYKDESLEGIKNLFADITASFTLYVAIVAGKKQLQIVKEFLDETFYSLNDSAKAFLIIVSTDTFVGYHSSDGWEVLLSSLLGHYGLPENGAFILAFIATVPVFLDGLFKFWIFQYLKQSSPSTSVIYSEMNE